MFHSLHLIWNLMTEDCSDHIMRALYTLYIYRNGSSILTLTSLETLMQHSTKYQVSTRSVTF